MKRVQVRKGNMGSEPPSRFVFPKPDDWLIWSQVDLLGWQQQCSLLIPIIDANQQSDCGWACHTCMKTFSCDNPEHQLVSDFMKSEECLCDSSFVNSCLWRSQRMKTTFPGLRLLWYSLSLSSEVMRMVHCQLVNSKTLRKDNEKIKNHDSLHKSFLCFQREGDDCLLFK